MSFYQSPIIFSYPLSPPQNPFFFPTRPPGLFICGWSGYIAEPVCPLIACSSSEKGSQKVGNFYINAETWTWKG